MSPFDHPFLWLLGALGFAGVALLAVGLIVGSPVLLAFLQTKAGRIGAIVAAIALGVLALMSKERAAGAAAQQAKQEKENDDFLKQVHDRDAARDDLSDDDLDRLLGHPRDPGTGGQGG